MAFASSRIVRVGAAIVLSLGMTAGLASTVHASTAVNLVATLPGETWASGSCSIGGAPNVAVAGTPVTVNAVDGSGVCNSVSDTSLVVITSTDANAVLPVSHNLVGGTSTFSVTFRTAGSWTVTASDAAHVLNPWTTGSVTVGPATNAGLQVLLPGETGAPGTILGKTGSPAGATTSVSFPVTVNAVDQYWNIETGYLGKVVLSSSDLAFLSSDPSGYQYIAGDKGTHVFSVEFKTTGTQDVIATGTGPSLSGTSAPVVVTAPKTAQTISFTSTAPSAATVGGATYTPTATATSGLTVALTIDATATSVCSISGGVVSFAAAGTCVIDANQLGNGTYSAAAQVQQSFSVAAATTVTHFVVSGLTSPRIAGVAGSVTVVAENASNATVTGYAGTVHLTSSDSAAVLGANATLTNGIGTFSVTLKTVGTQSVTATDTVTSSITGSQTGIVVNPAAASTLVVSGIASPQTAGVASTVTVTAKDAYGNIATGYTGIVHFTSSDGAAVLPVNYTFTGASGDAGVHTFSLTLNTGGTQSVTATDTVTSSITGSQSGIVVQGATPGTYHPLTPARLLDSRINLGITGKLSALTPASFLVWGRGGVPSNAMAVTGNLTVVNETSGWAVFLGPASNSSPTSSTINFSAGQVVANGVTVALSPTGYLWATYLSTSGQTTDLVFDVTGYFTPDTTGAYYHQISPVRLLDTRINLGIVGHLPANTPESFQVTNLATIPSNANAVTGNLTVTGSTAGWAVFLGPTAVTSPTSSTINFTAGQIVANGVTVQLSNLGYLWATYISTTGQTTDLVFDVTGYFVQGDTTGYRYVPVAPARVLDTRYGIGLSGAKPPYVPQTFPVWGQGGVPSAAYGVTGNLTITDETSGWAVFLGPTGVSSPTSSTINFTTGQIVANGVTVGLSPTGTLSATYIASSGNTTDLVFDVTGYFIK